MEAVSFIGWGNRSTRRKPPTCQDLKVNMSITLEFLFFLLIFLIVFKFRIPYKNYNQNDYTRHNSVDSVSHFALDSHEVCRLKETQSKISVGKIRILMLWTYSPLNLDNDAFHVTLWRNISNNNRSFPFSHYWKNKNKMLNKSQYYQNSPDNAHALSYVVLGKVIFGIKCSKYHIYIYNISQ
jgi:hypothetical protein